MNREEGDKTNNCSYDYYKSNVELYCQELEHVIKGVTTLIYQAFVQINELLPPSFLFHSYTVQI